MALINRRYFLIAAVSFFSLGFRSISGKIRNKTDWRRARTETLLKMQRVMGTLPKLQGRLDIQYQKKEDYPLYTQTKCNYLTDEGDRVPAYILSPHHTGVKLPAVVCLHQTTSYGKNEPVGIEGDKNMQYARELAERGFVCIVPDYPFLGENHMNPYEQGYSSCTMKGIVNHMRAVDVLVSLPNVDVNSIGAIGHSLGGHNALFLAAFDDRVKKIVTSCGFTSFRKYKAGNLTGWSGERYMPLIATVFGNSALQMPFDFSDILASIAPRPMFISAPIGDDNFDVTGVQDCVRIARAVYQRVFKSRKLIQSIYPECGHDFPKDVRELAYSFLKS